MILVNPDVHNIDSNTLDARRKLTLQSDEINVGSKDSVKLKALGLAGAELLPWCLSHIQGSLDGSTSGVRGMVGTQMDNTSERMVHAGEEYFTCACYRKKTNSFYFNVTDKKSVCKTNKMSSIGWAFLFSSFYLID